MTQEEVTQLMLSSKNDNEWKDNAEKVKAAFGGDYPPFWFQDIILGGVMQKALNKTPTIWVGDKAFPIEKQT